MASAIDICNEALSHLGDSATVSSIDPPEGSPQAEHCARFYGTSLATLIELHSWSFATRRAPLARVANPSSTWSYAYAVPSDCINIFGVLAPDAANDNSTAMQSQGYASPYFENASVGGVYTPQQFISETDANGLEIILTNQVNAVLRYTRLVTDTTRFTPMFSEALTWMLASKLAGPVLKGEMGRDTGVKCMQVAMTWLARAKDSDASQQRVDPQHHVSWMNAR